VGGKLAGKGEKCPRPWAEPWALKRVQSHPLRRNHLAATMFRLTRFIDNPLMKVVPDNK